MNDYNLKSKLAMGTIPTHLLLHIYYKVKLIVGSLTGKTRQVILRSRLYNTLQWHRSNLVLAHVFDLQFSSLQFVTHTSCLCQKINS